MSATVTPLKTQSVQDGEELYSHKCKVSEAIEMVTLALQCKLVPMIWGPPAIGKSQIVHQVAEKYNLCLIDERLAQCDPTDMKGFPAVFKKDGRPDRAGFMPMNTFPIEGDPLPINPKTGQPYAGWLLFLDELTSAPREVQASAYKLILDRMVGQERIHPNVAIVGAGNREEDNAIVEPMSTALQSRLVHMELVLDVKEWLAWANKEKLDHRVTSFIGYRPELLYTFKPDHCDKTYAAPRTWEAANRVISRASIDKPTTIKLVAGCITPGVTYELAMFCQIEKDLPKLAQILIDPDNTPVPYEPSILFMLTGSLASQATPSNLDKLTKYIGRLPVEHQTICLRHMLQRSPALRTHPEILKWVQQFGDALF